MVAEQEMKWLGQRHEDEIIARFLLAEYPRFVGRVLDIGAHDGQTFSNTARLLEAGWGGVLVEPSPAPLAALIKRYKGRADIRCVGAVVVSAPTPLGFVTWYDSDGDCVSTVVESHRELWSSVTSFSTCSLLAVSLNQLLLAFPGPYHVVSVDVEGLNAELFLSLPLVQLETRVVVVEHEGKDTVLRAYAEKLGFTRIGRTAENLILARTGL